MGRSSRWMLARVTACVLSVLSIAAPSAQASEADPAPLLRARCGPGSRPETGRQGRVSLDDFVSGRAAKGYQCNVAVVGRFGNPSVHGGSGGFKVLRYTDRAGHDCAYYDTTGLYPLSAEAGDLTGVFVLDMTDPKHPKRTEVLLSPAMQSPHESLSLSTRRGLLAAVMGNPQTYPGIFDIYDLSKDCRYPRLRSSMPLGILGHEGNFAPDGRTFYASSAGGGTLVALDVSDPQYPEMVWVRAGLMQVHGLNVSNDGNRLYYADTLDHGLTILDVSQVQARKQDPKVPVVSHLTWKTVSIPQVPVPVTIRGRPYLVEIDEYSRNVSPLPDAPVGAARIIDIADERRPRVVSDIRLEVHTAAARADQVNDPGATTLGQGYGGHYCAVPRREEPGIVACSFILSGLRVIDIRDPHNPKEIAYFNPPGNDTNYAMSAPAFAPERNEIWYSDFNKGFFALRLTNRAWSAR